MIKLLNPGEPIARNWRTINEVAAVLNGSDVPQQSDRAAIAGLRSRGREPKRPLQPYQGGTWLKWFVATGYVVTTGAPIIPTAVDTEFLLTTPVARYWFYIDFTSTPEVKKSSTDLTWSSTLVPLGWVDTSTYAADEIAIYHPVDLFHPCV
jgi:hypothetical protein